MTTNTIKHIHVTENLYQPSFYFVLNNRLLRFDICTPAFNDYNEWRIKEITFSKDNYKPDENEMELKPLTNISEITLTDKEFEFFELVFCDNGTNYSTEMKKLHAKDNNVCEPYSYLYNGCSLFNFGFNQDKEPCFYLSEFKTSSSSIEAFDDDFDIEDSFIDGAWMEEKNWQYKENITVPFGLYNLFIPLMKEIALNYEKRMETMNYL